MLDLCMRTRAEGAPIGSATKIHKERELLSGTSVYGTCPVGRKRRMGRELIQRSRAEERRADVRGPAGASYFYSL